jgi:hypothetical protein
MVTQSPMIGAHALRDVFKAYNYTLRRLQIRDAYHSIQREIDVYLDMNGAGRKRVLENAFPTTCWIQFLAQTDIVRCRLNVSFPQGTIRGVPEENDTNPMSRQASLDEGYCKCNKFEVG